MEELAKGESKAKSSAPSKSRNKQSSVSPKQQSEPAKPRKSINPITWLIKSVLTLVLVVALPIFTTGQGFLVFER